MPRMTSRLGESAVADNDAKRIPLAGAVTGPVIAVLRLIHLAASFFARPRNSSRASLEDRIQKLEDLNEQLRKSRNDAEAASAAKSQFLATISHEVRPPLSGVIGMAGFLATTELNDDQSRLVSTIETGGDELLRTFDDIADLARIEDGRMTIDCRPFSLVDCVEDALEHVAVQASRKGLEVGYIVQSGISDSFIGGGPRIQQVLEKLLDNAVKFTPAGSVVVIVDSQTSTGTHSALLSFRVVDTGIGMSEGALQNLFEPFSHLAQSASGKREGTGLGLIVAKELVELMGGTIRAASREGEGATFTFSVVVGTDTPEPAASPAMSGDRTLVACRTEVAADLMCSHLRRLGADPTAVAVEHLADGSIDADSYQLVVTDDPLAASRLSTGRCPVVAVLDVHHSQPVRADGVVARPIRSRRLRNVILEAMSGPAGRCAGGIGSAREIRSAREIGGTRESAQENGPPRILVAENLGAENLGANQPAIGRTLSSIGLGATAVSNSAQAAEVTRQERFEIILIDLDMAMLGGIEEIRSLRKNAIERPYIVAVTASTALRSPAQYVPLGIDECLMKPIGPSQLAAAVDGYYRRTARWTAVDSPTGTNLVPVRSGAPAHLRYQPVP